jgi:hypothetical protein
MSFGSPLADSHPHLRQISRDTHERPIVGLAEIMPFISSTISGVSAGFLVIMVAYSTVDSVSTALRENIFDCFSCWLSCSLWGHWGGGQAPRVGGIKNSAARCPLGIAAPPFTYVLHIM